jgi:hypothetical protein
MPSLTAPCRSNRFCLFFFSSSRSRAMSREIDDAKRRTHSRCSEAGSYGKISSIP